MRYQVTIITMIDHPPSLAAEDAVKFWLGPLASVLVSTVYCTSLKAVQHAKKRYKFDDLPCLIVEKNTGFKRWRKDKYHGFVAIEDRVKEIHDEFDPVRQAENGRRK